MAEELVNVSEASSSDVLSLACQLDGHARRVLVRVIGPVELVADGGVVSLRSSRTRRLIAMLALYRDRVVSRDRLVDAVWGESLPADPNAALQSQLSRLRSSLGTAATGIETTSGGYRLRTDVLGVDVDVFEAVLAAAREPGPTAAQRAALLDQAVGMVRGAAFEDLEVDDAYIEARRVQDLAVSARLAATAAHVETGTVPLPVARRAPVPLGDVVGRTEDLDAIASLLASRRVVTLTGPGGVGKTTLALASVQRHCTASGIPNAFVDLASVSSAAEVPEAFARGLGVERTGDQPWIDRLVEAIGGTRLLLLVDNAEHVAAMAAGTITELAARTDVVVLTTSRLPLNVPGEHLWIVEPLDCEGPARQLFYQRAQAVRPSWASAGEDDASVRAICRRVDGLPLAIELAAAQLRWRSAAEIAASLDQPLEALEEPGSAGGGHPDLRTVIDRSYRLLDEREQAFFDGVGVFADGFTAASAAAVCCGSSAEIGPAVRIIGALVQHSLVHARPSSAGTRYMLLETVRHFALERLGLSHATEAVRDRHATAMLDFVEQATGEMWGPDEASWVVRIDDERADICAAHHHLSSSGDTERALRLASAAYWVAWPRGWSDLRGLIRSTAIGGPATPDVLGRALGARADVALHDGDPDAATEFARRSLSAARHQVELSCYGEAVLADIALFAGRTDEAVVRWKAARDGFAVARGVPYPWATAAIALAVLYGGRPDEAAVVAQEAVETADALGSATARAFARYAAGEAARGHDPDWAQQVLTEAIAIATSAEVTLVANLARLSLATLLARRGDPSAALAHYPVLLSEWRRSGHWAQQWIALRTLVPILVEAGALEPAGELLHGLQTHGQAEAWGGDSDNLRAAQVAIETSHGDRNGPGRARRAAMTPVDLVLFAEHAAAAAAGNDQQRSYPVSNKAAYRAR